MSTALSEFYIKYFLLIFLPIVVGLNVHRDHTRSIRDGVNGGGIGYLPSNSSPKAFRSPKTEETVVTTRTTDVKTVEVADDDDDVELNVLGCRVDILGTNCDQCGCMVQCYFTSTETVRLIRTRSPGRPPRLSHSS